MSIAALLVAKILPDKDACHSENENIIDYAAEEVRKFKFSMFSKKAHFLKIR